MPASPEGLHCEDCRGHRLHRARLSARKGPKGERLRVMACTACERETAVPPKECPGVCCPRCGDTRLVVAYTRHRPGATVRVKRCRGCNHRVRTKEVVEAWAC